MRVLILLPMLIMQLHDMVAAVTAPQPNPFVAYDMTWALPVGTDCARALRFLERLKNRLAIYSVESQSLHFNYQLSADTDVGLIGVQLSDAILIPSAAIDATPSYIISGELVERDGLQIALWHHPRKPPLVYPLSGALQRMINDNNDYFFPILHEHSVSILPQSQHAVARLYRLKLADLDRDVVDVENLRARLNSSLVALLSA